MADTLIIGGGLIGLLSALELAKEGLQVKVFERGYVGRESSWAGGGILSPLYPWRYPDAVTELARWSQAHYYQLCNELLEQTGLDPEWTQSGLLMPGLDDDEQVKAFDWADRFGYTLYRLTSDESHTLSPAVKAESALWMPDVAQVRNPRLLKALKSAVRLAGVEVSEGSPVTGLVIESGQVRGIRTEQGREAAGNVAICGGAWSGEIAAQLGARVPIQPVKGQMLLFSGQPGVLRQIVLSDGYYVIPRRDGRVLVGSTLEHTGFDKQTTAAARDELWSQAKRIFPPIEEMRLEKQWAGLRPGTSDGIPLIGQMPGYEGLYINAGHYRNGVVTGYASARLLKELMAGEVTELNSGAYDPELHVKS